MSRRGELLVTYVVLTVFAAIALAPLVGVVLLALHGANQQISGLSLPDGLHFENFSRAWNEGQFSLYFRSSLIVTLSVVIVGTVLSILAGYAFGAMEFPGRDKLFLVMLLGLIVPFEATIVPLYYDLRSVELDNTYWALILPQIGLSTSFGSFWMRAYFRAVPRSLFEAARVDGASSFAVLYRVLVPVGRPAILTLMLLFFLWSWNEFYLALVMVSEDKYRTAPLGIANFTQQYTVDQTGLAAAATLVALPVVFTYVLLQRHFIRGMLAGSVKG